MERNDNQTRQLNQYRKGISVIINVICVLVILVILYPGARTTLYTYPVQDDYDFALQINAQIGNGSGLLSGALRLTIDRYNQFSGCYSSMFIDFVASGIVNCSIGGTRAYLAIMYVLFYVSLLFAVYSFVKYVLSWPLSYALPLFTGLVMGLHTFFYYVENEPFLWFIGSTAYITVMCFELAGVGFFIMSVKRKRIWMLTIAVFCGFIGGGGSLNIAVMGCVLYFLVGCWGILQKKWAYSLVGVLSITVGAFINVIAPGNFVRAGKSIGTAECWSALEDSFKAVFDRYYGITDRPLFWALLVALIIIVFSVKTSDDRKQRKNAKIHSLVMMVGITGVLIVGLALIVFPVVLGYNVDVYSTMDRALFFTDLFFFIVLVLFVVQLRVTVGCFWGKGAFPPETFPILLSVVFFSILIAFNASGVPNVPFVKEYLDLSEGRVQSYSDNVVSILSQIQEKAKEDTTIIIIEDDVHAQDNSTLVNTKWTWGEYDYTVVPGNAAEAHFYGKDAVYLMER